MPGICFAPAVRMTRALAIAGSMALMLGCASAPPRDDVRYSGPAGAKIAHIARDMRGRPYQWGGDDPSGFDCSGLVQYSYTRAGLDVPRTSQQLYSSADRLYLRQIQPGDLVFFRIDGASAAHVGIYIGDHEFVHAPKSQGSVHVSSLEKPYWRQRLTRVGTFTH